MEDNNLVRKCPRCQVTAIGDSFHFSHLPTKPVSADEVHSKVCRHTDGKGCINLHGQYDSNVDYLPLPPFTTP